MIIILFLVFKLVSSNENCTCDLVSLGPLETLYPDVRRVRIEHPTGFFKFSNSYLVYNKQVECLSKIVYSNLKCRSCLTDGWSDFFQCGSISCDRDDLKPPFVIETLDPIGNSDQTLFQAYHVLGVYNFSPGKRICKYCQSNGRWSKLADNKNCFKINQAKQNCRYSDLLDLEEKELEFVRIHMETSDGFKIVSDETPSNTIVVYESYLGTLAGIFRFFLPNEPADYFRKKYCRYCENGMWSDIESCTHFNCNKEILTGGAKIISIDKTQVLNEKKVFFKPNSVLAVYEFGTEKFCKRCETNGEWSKYSSKDLCKIPAKKSELKHVHKLYKNEKFCNINNFSKIILPDRKQLLTSLKNTSLIPSRSLGLNEDDCKLCINGQWTNSTDCEVKYCLRDDTQNGVFRLDDFSVAKNSQNLFEPGTVRVEYNLTDTTRLCRVCELINGSIALWSKFSSPHLCDSKNSFFKPIKFVRAPKFCSLDDTIEKTGFILQHVVSWNGRLYIKQDPVPESSMAVYVNENVKWCSMCSNGVWDPEFMLCPIEFGIKKCDKTKVLGVNYFVYASDGVILNDKQKNELVFPGEVFAVYEFGSRKYCKECQNDGNWSPYPQFNLCNKIKF